MTAPKTAAERQREQRRRLREGAQPVKVEITENQKAELVRLGYLDLRHVASKARVAEAFARFIDDQIGE